MGEGQVFFSKRNINEFDKSEETILKYYNKSLKITISHISLNKKYSIRIAYQLGKRIRIISYNHLHISLGLSLY